MDGEPGDQMTGRIDVLGVPVDPVDMQLCLIRVSEMLEKDATHIVAATNPEKVIAALDDPALLDMLNEADLVIPDGIGVVAAARILCKTRMTRVAGADLMPEICALAARLNRSVFLFGAKPGVAVKAAKLLQSRYAGLKVSGTRDGYVKEEQMPALLAEINSSGADVLFVGLGSPRQEFWMQRYRYQLKVRICQGVGGSFDAICGHTRRAPLVFRKLHLEWFYRLMSQPKRLGRQTALPRFVVNVGRALLSSSNR